MAISLLHLTDLHLGQRQLPEEDFKDVLEPVVRARSISRLTDYLRCLSQVPDYVLIAGDLTIGGDDEGFHEFRSWIKPLIGDVLPDERHVLITPGNHDVDWDASSDRRYGKFFEAVKGFAHAWLPGSDPPLDADDLGLDFSTGLVGGVSLEYSLGSANVESSRPFLLDLDKRLLLYAFNSTLGGGSYSESDRAHLEELRALEAFLSDGSAERKKLTATIAKAEGTLRVDAPIVGAEQREYFKRVTARIRAQIGADEFAALTKVAMLHHHVTHLWRQPFELKRFEMVADAALVKQLLIESGFDIVVHGHKHINQVSIDGSIIPISEKDDLKSLTVVSGGTVGGNPARHQQQTFKIDQSAVVKQQHCGGRDGDSSGRCRGSLFHNRAVCAGLPDPSWRTVARRTCQSDQERSGQLRAQTGARARGR